MCTMGFMFLVAFGLYGITSLIRLEFASDGRNAAAPFRRRLSLSYSDSEPCPAIDYGLAFSGLAFDVLFALIARHVVDVMGRHPCLAGLAAFAGGGLLFLCIPEYFPWAKGASINLVICMMSMAVWNHRVVLHAIDATTPDALVDLRTGLWREVR